MTINDENLRAILWIVFLIIFTTNGWTYAMVYTAMTGRSVLEIFKVRTDKEIEEDRRRHHAGKIHLVGEDH